MLHAFGKPSANHDGIEVSYKAPLHHLRQFGCYSSRPIPKPQRHGKFSTIAKPCMMVGYVHDLTTHARMWEPAFRIVRSQLDVIFDEERNAHSSCLHRDQTDICEQPEEMEYVEEIETGGDGLLQDHAGTSRTGEGLRSGDNGFTADNTDHFLPNADNHPGPPSNSGVRSHTTDEEDAPPVSRDTVVHNRHLRRNNDKAGRMAAHTTQSCQPPHPNRITRSHDMISAKDQIIIAKAFAITASDPFIYAEVMHCP